MEPRLVAVGHKLSRGKTVYVTYALLEQSWHPKVDPRADPDLHIDVDELRKQRLEEHDVEDF